MKKRSISIMMSLTVMASLLAGCGNGGSGTTVTEAAKTEGTKAEAAADQKKEDSGAPTEEKTLEFMWFADGDETTAMRKVLDQYEESHPGIKVELVEVPYADLNEKLMMAITGGEAPALARVTGSVLFKDVALDLTDALGGAETFFADYPESMKSNTGIILDGKIYAIPGEASITGLIYNKTAFEKAGVSVPESADQCWTWEEFNAALKKVVEGSDVRYGLALDATSQRWSNILYEFGGHFLTEDGQPVFTSEEAKKALEFTKASFDDGTWIKSIWLGGEDATNLFVSGQAAAHIGGSWKIAAYNNDIKDFEWGVTYLPYEITHGNCTGYKQFMGFQGSGYEEEAKELLAYLASAEAASYYTDSLYISPRLDGANLEYAFGSEEVATLNADAAMATPLSTLDWGYSNFSSAYNTVIINAVKEYIAGNISVEDCMAEIDGAAENLSK